MASVKQEFDETKDQVANRRSYLEETHSNVKLYNFDCFRETPEDILH